MNRETTRSSSQSETTDEYPGQGKLFRVVGSQFMVNQEQVPPVREEAATSAMPRLGEPPTRIETAAQKSSQRSEHSAYDRRIECLRRDDCYQKHLQAMDFQPVNVDLNSELHQILPLYRESSTKGRTQARDRRILKLELRLLVGSHYGSLHDEINEKFPGSYNYEHLRKDPYATTEEESRLIWRDEVSPLNYRQNPARLIVDSIMVDALFGLPANRIKRGILQNNFQSKSRSHRPLYISRPELNRLDLNDYLPNEFLIGRLWMLQRLLYKLEHTDQDFERVIRSCEALGYEVRYCLEDLSYSDGKTAYNRLNQPLYTQPLREETEKLLDWQEKVEAA